MASQTITVDTREFERRMRRLTNQALVHARLQASHDAANQTKTLASRLVGKELNLPSAKIKEKLPVKAIRGSKSTYYELRAKYEQIGAQGFTGWKYSGKSRGRAIRSTAKSTLFGKGRTTGGGLVFKPYRNQPPLRFQSAFPLRGGSFFKRKLPSTRKSRGAWSLNMPVERIVGPSIHGAMENAFPEAVRYGYQAYRRRLAYWAGKEIRKI